MEIEYFKYNILPLKDKLFRKALSITESVHEAQDVVQEVMMRLWDKRSEWAAIVNIEVYSMVLAKNIALDRIKKSGYYSEPIDVAQKEFAVSDSNHAQASMEKEERMALVWKVIRLLPERQQQLIRLRDIEDTTYQEIAVEMNITEAQVKIGLFRARQRMKEIYLKLNNNDEY